MIYDFRMYTFKPGGIPDYMAAVEELSIPIRAKYGVKLAGWYYSDIGELNQVVQADSSGESQLCFFLNSTPIKKMVENALADLLLPQKSTDFYTKLLSGLAIYWMDNPLGL